MQSVLFVVYLTISTRQTALSCGYYVQRPEDCGVFLRSNAEYFLFNVGNPTLRLTTATNWLECAVVLQKNWLA